VPAISLDLPAPMRRTIRELRLRYKSWRAAIPPAITIAGSSGLGELLLTAENAPDTLDALQAITRRTRPIRARFARVGCFPDTTIYYFTLDESEPFCALHDMLRKAPLPFGPSPFPFTPHCTIADDRSVGVIDLEQLWSLEPPGNTFTISKLSLYTLSPRILSGDPLGCSRLISLPLGR
jgi:2'-5' RNA ligase